MGKVVLQRNKLGLTNKTEAHNKARIKRYIKDFLFCASIIINIYFLTRT